MNIFTQLSRSVPAFALITLVLISSIMVLSCDSTSNAPNTLPMSASESLLGRWNLVKYSGGWIGKTVVTDPNRPTHVTYSADGRYIVVVDGDTATNGTYTVTEEETVGSPSKKITVITYSDYWIPRAIVDSVSKSGLKTIDLAADGHTTYYDRIVSDH